MNLLCMLGYHKEKPGSEKKLTYRVGSDWDYVEYRYECERCRHLYYSGDIRPLRWVFVSVLAVIVPLTLSVVVSFLGQQI